MIFTKDDKYTTDEQVENLNREFNIISDTKIEVIHTSITTDKVNTPCAEKFRENVTVLMQVLLHTQIHFIFLVNG